MKELQHQLPFNLEIALEMLSGTRALSGFGAPPKSQAKPSVKRVAASLKTPIQPLARAVRLYIDGGVEAVRKASWLKRYRGYGKRTYTQAQLNWAVSK